MPRRLHRLASLLPPVSRLRAQRDELAAQVRLLQVELAGRRGGTVTQPLYPPGHFYSPEPNLEDVQARSSTLFSRTGEVAGVDLRVAEQLQLLKDLAAPIRQWPYSGRTAVGTTRRFQPDNGFFGHTDGRLWYGLLSRLRPRRIIEIGSGWSTALVLDTIDQHQLDVQLTCVEPYPERLRSIATAADLDRITLLEERAQDVDPSVLTSLGAGDVLFIDSTHVSKIGSDVNHLAFEVLPRLTEGVLVHVHDIAYPFEYPQEWVLEGRAWNEAYVLRALLMENPRWEIMLWPSLLWLRHPTEMKAALGATTPVDGGSLWLRRR